MLELLADPAWINAVLMGAAAILGVVVVNGKTPRTGGNTPRVPDLTLTHNCGWTDSQMEAINEILAIIKLVQHSQTAVNKEQTHLVELIIRLDERTRK